MPVQEAELVRSPHQRVDLPGHVDDRQPGHRCRVLDRREPVTRWMHDEQRRVGVIGGQRGHGDDGVDPAAEGDERPPRLAARRRAARRRPVSGPDHPQVAQVEAVAVGELAEAAT